MANAPHLRLDGRTAVVTGAAGGIGSAVSRAFAANGAQLVLVDVNGEGLARLATTLDAPTLTVTADVTDAAAVAALAGQVIERFGSVDILVNNAGGNGRVLPHEVTLEHWERLVRLNLTSAFLMSQAFGRHMIRQGHGNIVNVSSTCGVSGMGRGNFVFSIAKAGLNHMTRELALEWGASGIRVNGVVPAQIEVAGSMRDWREWVDAEGVVMAEKIVRGTPLSRAVTPDDIAGPVLFLASDASAMVTGTLIPVDGGSLTLNRISTVGQPIRLD
jgi:NAD(P)-dependent dehydrogenase (short-subunit alcohol dehydrogenase family)